MHFIVDRSGVGEIDGDRATVVADLAQDPGPDVLGGAITVTASPTEPPAQGCNGLGA
jgi:hypothetical protein